ncbi:MAG: hypothetical protein PHP53_13540 [Prolixibacteraceae bacterium]|nr:hypothetical protein [Prolixibacteraceae bacterium]
MNEQELKLLWHSTNEKLESSLRVNKNNTDEITRLKAQNVLASMKPTKLFTLIVGIIWVIGLGSILGNLIVNHLGDVSLFFLLSATIQVLLTAITIGIYVYQIDLISKIDFSEPVLTIQEKVSKLKISTLNVTRLLFLQLPVWTTFYWNERMFLAENWLLWVLQAIVTISFVYIALWLFFNIKYENRNKKWFKLIFRGKEWEPVLQSMELLNQIEQYQEPGEEDAATHF